LGYQIEFFPTLVKDNDHLYRELAHITMTTGAKIINFALVKLLRTATEEVRERQREVQSWEGTLQLGFHPKASTKSLRH